MKYGAIAALIAAVSITACQSDRPKPLTAKNVSAPLTPPPGYLPPGLATPLKAGDAVSLKAPLPLLTAPRAGSASTDRLPAGMLVTLKTRVLNTAGPWWLVQTATTAGWVPEQELLSK